jgi:hypothetical protein
MNKFKIQDTMKINSCGTRCTKCSKVIERKVGTYRVKYGQGLFHLSCFYIWLKGSLPKLEQRNIALRDYYEQLKVYMPQILAESITNNK